VDGSDTGDTSAQKNKAKVTGRNKPKPDKCISFNSFINSETKSQIIFVKGKLKPKLNYWKETLNAPHYILDVIENGYRIPFMDLPERSISTNNVSAFKNFDFVSESIRELLADGSEKK